MSTKEELTAKIIEKASVDPSFKKELLSNPKAAVQTLTQKDISAASIKIIEEGAGELVIVLPSDELLDSDLDGVAGGGVSDWF
jgi:hypothetical protein